MTRIVYLNGSFLPIAGARLSVMDRGFLFGDGIYEVSAVLDGRLVDNDAHLARLERSLAAIRIALPLPLADIVPLQEKLIALNGLQEGTVYIEITRGVAERDFSFPKDVEPTFLMFTQPKNIIASPLVESGIKTVTVPDLRWSRRDIKSVALLAQVLAKQEATERGAAEALMVQDGQITEGASSSIFAVTRDGRLLTRPLSTAILAGITRNTVLRLAQEAGLVVEERSFSVEEALASAELFMTSASNLVLGIVSVDGKPVADGTVGPITRKARALYIDLARR